MNVEIGTEALILLFWEYLFQISGILSLQCTPDLIGRVAWRGGEGGGQDRSQYMLY
jgi:hypothetical protein